MMSIVKNTIEFNLCTHYINLKKVYTIIYKQRFHGEIQIKMSNMKSHSNGLQELARLECSHLATKTLKKMFFSIIFQLKANRVDYTESKPYT